MGPADLIVVVVTLVIVLAVIGLHYEVLSRASRYLPTISHRRRQRVFFLILVIIGAHFAEIWLFALGYYVFSGIEEYGALVGVGDGGIGDYAYYSAVVYTMVGFGDMVPEGAIRFLTGTEALTGLVMITWSASFTFLEMQRDWPGGR